MKDKNPRNWKGSVFIFRFLVLLSLYLCFLLYSSWLLVFILYVFNLFFLSLNLFCWKGFHFSWSNSLIFILIIAYLFFSLHFWIKDLIREFNKKYEVLLINFFLLFLIFLVSECLLFVSFFWTSFHSLSSLTLWKSSICCSSFSLCSFFRSCNYYLLWNNLQWRKDCWL